MKKVTYLLVGLLVIIALAVVVVPIVLEEPIKKAVKEESNKNLNATLNFSDVELSLIWSFPDLYVGIENLTIVNAAPFEGDTLVYLETLVLDVDLMSAFDGKPNINDIVMENGLISTTILEDGTASYDILPSDSETTSDSTAQEAGGGFGISIDHFGIEDVRITYNDQQGGMSFSTPELEMDLSGDLAADRTMVNTVINMSNATLVKGGIAFLNHANVELKADLDADLANSAYELKENELLINGLHLTFGGVVRMANETDTELDLTFAASKTEFKEILSLIPAIYQKDFEDIKTTGSLALKGTVNGILNDDIIPGFNIDLDVSNGTFKYPDLPKGMDNIQVKLNVKNPGGDPDLTLIDLSRFHFELAGNPFDIVAKISNPVNDPFVDASFKGKIDLKSLAEALPMGDDAELSGSLISDFSLKARNSDIEKKRLNRVDAKGELIVMNVLMNSDSLPAPLSLTYAQFKFTPAFLELTALDGALGDSDLKANGKIENYIGFALNDEDLKGRFNVSSTLMNLDMFAVESEGERQSENGGSGSDGAPQTVIEVPKNLDVRLDSKFVMVKYDGLELTNVNGVIVLRDGVANLSNLSMNVFDGTVAVNGSYSTKNIEDPKINMNLDVKNIDVQELANSMESMDKIVPIAKSTQGRASVNFNMKGSLDGTMEPIYNSLNGGGRLTSSSLKLKGAGALDKVAEVVKMNAFKDPELKNVNLSFKFINGRVHVQPFDTKVGPVNASIFGSHGFDQTLDYVMQTSVPTAALGSEVNNIVGGLVAQANSLGTNFTVGDKIDVDILIKGTSDKPKITPRFGGSSGGGASATEDLKKQAEEELKRQQEELERKAKAEADKLKKQAEAEAKRLQEEAERKAKAEAERLRKEAEEKAKKEGEKILNGLFGPK